MSGYWFAWTQFSLTITLAATASPRDGHVGGTIEVRLDSPTGQLLGQTSVGNTAPAGPGARHEQMAHKDPARMQERSAKMKERMAKRLGEPEKAYVSRYALGRDYHKLIRKRLQQLADVARIGLIEVVRLATEDAELVAQRVELVGLVGQPATIRGEGEGILVVRRHDERREHATRERERL